MGSADDKEKTGSFKLPLNGNLGKVVKTGGALGLILAFSYFFNQFVKPDIIKIERDVKEMQLELKDYSLKAIEADVILKYQAADVIQLKEEIPKIQADIADIKGDIKVILVKLSQE